MKRTRNKIKNYRIPDAINCSPESNFTIIPNHLIKTNTISCKAKVILFILLSNKDGWQSHITTLLTMVKEGISTIQTGVRELEKLGYLKRVQYRDKKTKQKAGSFWAYSNIPYNLEYKKQAVMLGYAGYELYPEKPQVEKLDVEKLDVEKLPLIILNNNNTNNKKKKNIIKKDSPFSSFKEQLPNTFLENKTFLESLNDYIIHRINLKVPLTELAIKKLSNKFKKFKVEEVIQALDDSVETGKWSGVYPKSKNTFKSTGKNSYKEENKTYRKSDMTI